MPQTTKPAFVYLVKSSGTNLYKIGSAANPELRLKQLRTGNAKLILVHTIKVCGRAEAYFVERVIQAVFAKQRLKSSRDWFYLNHKHVKKIKGSWRDFLPILEKRLNEGAVLTDPSMLTQQAVIELLRKRQGNMTQRAFAAHLGIDEAYLSRIYSSASLPTKKLLTSLGLRAKKEYLYEVDIRKGTK